MSPDLQASLAPWLEVCASRLTHDPELRRDLIQEGWRAALEAEARYDAGRGATLRTYLGERAEGAMRHYARSQTRQTSGTRLHPIIALEPLRELEAPYDTADLALTPLARAQEAQAALVAAGRAHLTPGEQRALWYRVLGRRLTRTQSNQLTTARRKCRAARREAA